jgi:hypothetical protein
MKVNDIVRQVNRDIDDQYDFGDVIDWVNRALDDLTPIAKRQAMTELDDTLTFPADFHELAFVYQNNQELQKLQMTDNTNSGYKVWGNTLILQNVDTSPVTLYYYRKLSHVTNGDDIPELEPEFHDLLIYFCLGNMQFYDEDYQDRPDSFLRYENRKKQYSDFINGREKLDYIISTYEVM